MSEQKLTLISGLGNPGKKYSATRHNVGFMVIDTISDAFSIPLDKVLNGIHYGRGVMGDRKVILAKPMAFMNRSGPPIQNLISYYRILCEDVLIVHDDIDLAFGRLKIKEKGGHGGHNGVRSIIGAVGSGDFVRLRIGVGRPDTQTGVANFVLNGFSTAEKTELVTIQDRAKDAVVTILCKGAADGMNNFNRKL
ncbi:MAG: aminoacyl-tRNA hydrolase [Desulfobacteraceae bacterium]|nr:aminoacyl-tRNA hydrolase [Desulfobacteraceae bacterium]